MNVLDTIGAIPISLKQLHIKEVSIPRRTPFRSAIGVRHERRALLVRWIDQDDDWGIGECSCRPDPFFNGEYLNGALEVLRDFLFPLLPRQGTVKDVEVLAARARGWSFTRAALLDALFDCLRRKGYHDALDQWHEAPQHRIPVGISLPLFDTPEVALQSVVDAIQNGFRRVKLKVVPGMDLEPLQAIRETYPTLYLGLDANGSIREEDEPFIAALIAFRPAVLEQPFAPGRLDLDAALRERFPELRIGLDESVSGLGSLIAAHRLKALDELNLKPGRVGGGLSVLRLLTYCDEHNIPAWVGGMFETGIGRAANLRVASRLPKARAHDLSPSSRYLVSDIVASPLSMDEEGFVSYDDRPVTLNEAVIEQYTVRDIILSKPPGAC